MSTAKSPELRLLVVDPSGDDADRMRAALRQGGLAPVWERVGTADGLRDALAAGPWDAVLSAYSLSGFGAPAALKLVRAADPDLPFLVVSGAVGEDVAVEMMRATASDYILKHDLTRLAPAVERAVREAASRRAARAADQAAAHLAAVVKSSDDAIMSKTLDGVIVSWNSAAERLYGWPAAEAVGRHVSFLIPPDKADELAGHMARLQAGESVGYFETVRVHRDGYLIDVALTISLVRDADGRLVGVSKTARDIRVRKRAEEALRESEARYRGLIESIPSLVWVFDTTGLLLLHNRRWYEYTGQTPEETAADLWHQAIHPDDAAAAVAAWERCKASGEPFAHEYRLRRADGAYRWFLSQGMAQHTPEGVTQWVGTCTDIDDQMRAVEELRHTAAMLHAITNGTSDSVFVKNRAGQYLLFNPAAARSVGRPAEEVLGRDDTALFSPADASLVMARDRRVMESGQIETQEEELTAAGVTRTYLATKAPYRDATGVVIGTFGVSRDVTDQRRAAESLAASEARYRRLFEAAQDGILLVDPGTRKVVDTNPFLADLIGYRRDEVVGKELWEIGLFGDIEANQAAFRTLQDEGYVRYDDLPLRSKTGRQIDVEFVSNIYDVGGVPVIQCNIRDVTDQRRADAALREREGLLETVINHIPGGVFWKDRDSVILGCNARFAHDFGAESPADLVGRTDDLLTAPADARAFVARDRTVIEDGEPLLDIEESQTLPDGRAVTLLTSKVPLRGPGGEVVGVLGVYQDITDRKRAETERDELTARLSLQIERMPLAYLLSGPDFRYTRWNPAAERMFGFSEAEVLGRHPLGVIVPPQSEAVVAAVFARLEAGAMDAGGECENVTKDGRTIMCEWHNTPLFGPAGTFQGVMSLAQDVTARRDAEGMLRLRDRAIGAATQGIVISDAGKPDHPIVYVSPGFERMTGYESDEILGRNCRFLQGKDTDKGVAARIRAAIRAEETFTAELLNYRKEGTPFWNELSVSPVRDAAGRLTHYIGLQADVTARRTLEEQFRQVLKMEGVGQLAAGIAHDFNNLLTIINGYSDLLLDTLAPGCAARDMAAEIHQAGERSAVLTRQLLAFSRQQVLAPQVLDLNGVVADTEKMLRRLIGEDVRLATVLDPLIDAVRADPGQVEQVLMNLAVNARDAMPRGGRLTIETQNVMLDDGYTRSHLDARAGPHVLLSVTDTGSGMPPDVAARAFEPFFTTKGPGRGTGLGLATVHGIVRQSGGHVAVYSEVGVGTTFKVYLPCVEEAAGGSKPRSVPRTPPRGTETVLLSEDEAAVRALARRILVGCGYTVLEAADGDEAIRVAAGHAGPVHLLVTDVVMPGAGGRAVAEAVTARHPGVRVLFLSGYTDDAVIRHGVLRDGVDFLQKPFTPAALAAKVRDALDAPAKAGP